MSETQIIINLVSGKVAPRYDDGTEIKAETVTITEQSTQANLPLVDLVMLGPDGKRYLVVMTDSDDLESHGVCRCGLSSLSYDLMRLP